SFIRWRSRSSFPRRGKSLFGGCSVTERIKRIAAKLKDRYGEPRPKWPEDTLDVLVLTVLSQATTDANRDRAFQSFKEAFPTYDLVMAASDEEVARAIMSGGLAFQK